MRLLVTRPEEQGARTAQALRARGHDVMLAPILQIEPCIEADFGKGAWRAVVMTSANAAHALMRHPQRERLTRLQLFVVGDATQEAAREAGFTDIVSAKGDAHALATLVIARVPRGDLLYLAGEVVTGNLAEELEAAGFVVYTVTVYRAVPQTTLPPSVADALRERKIDAVLHYSRRSAETFLGLAGAAGVDINSLDCNQFCLSRQIGEPLLQAGLRAVHVAARPDEAAMLDLIDTQASQPAGRANG